MILSARGPLKGTVTVPGDKSVSHRAAIIGALADGALQVSNFAPGRDCAHTLRCLASLGVEIERCGSELLIYGRKGALSEPSQVLDCGNSGTTMRLLLGVLAGQPFHAVLTGDASLSRRPMSRVTEPLRRMGAEIDGREGGSYAPLAVAGGRLVGISYSLPVASAQVKSALLLAGLYCGQETRVREPWPSRDHTERMLQAFGVPLEVRSGEVVMPGGAMSLLTAPAEGVRVPGDLSSAAFLVAAALLVPGSEIEIRDVGLNPTRTGFLEVLEAMGARVRVRNVRNWGPEPVGDIIVTYGELKSFEVGPEDVPRLIDEIPVLALLATRATGISVFRGVGELRVKETDRLAAIAEELGKSGALVEVRGDDLVVRGPSRPESAQVDARGDHRMAMVLALSGLPDAQVRVEGVTAIKVSYPGFSDDLRRVGGEVKAPPQRALVGLIGHPVAHSLSPVMFRAAFREVGLDWSYHVFDVPPDDLESAVLAIRALGLRGVNVTIPHKVAVIPYLDELDPQARSIGAVNTVCNEGGRLVGYNTDVVGVLGALEMAGFWPQGRSAVILGAGGAARAAAFALAGAGVTRLHVANRSRARAESLAEAVAGGHPAVELTWSGLEEVPVDADLLVQATAVGMAPLEDGCPLPEEFPLGPDTTVLEMVYSPVETVLVKRARRAGARVVTGLSMLAYQGARSFELWTGVRAPVRTMWEALRGRRPC